LSLPIQCLAGQGHCRAHTFVQIEKGHFGEVRWMGCAGASWHSGGADPSRRWHSHDHYRGACRREQRAAIEAISHGQETDPGSLVWQVFSTTVSTFLPTLYKPIQLSTMPAPRTRGCTSLACSIVSPIPSSTR